MHIENYKILYPSWELTLVSGASSTEDFGSRIARVASVAPPQTVACTSVAVFTELGAAAHLGDSWSNFET